MILEFQRCFVKTKLAYRGHDEPQDSEHPGNWRECLRTMEKTNSTFAALQSAFKQQHKLVSYTGNRSCVKMIEVMAECVRDKLKQQIQVSCFYALMIDEYKDNSVHDFRVHVVSDSHV